MGPPKRKGIPYSNWIHFQVVFNVCFREGILQKKLPGLRMDPYAVVHWTGAEVLHLDRFLGAEF